jgi:hypothetical protein
MDNHHKQDSPPALVFALFHPTTPLGPLLDQLRDKGFADWDMEVVSPLPLEGIFLHKPPRIPLYVIAIIAGLVGIGVGLFLAGGTAAMYPIMTGGKPIISLPVVGIISYETMMLFAIVTTFVVTAAKIGIVHDLGLSHDPRIDEGSVGVSVRILHDERTLDLVQRLMQESGATAIEVR